MKRYEIIYFFREGIRGVFLHGFMSFAAISVIAACLLIMGSFSLIAVNVDRVIEELRNQNEILVFVEESLSLAEAKSIGTRINTMMDNNIDKCEWISKDQAYEDWISQFGDQQIFDDIEDKNFLRHRYAVRLSDVSLMQEAIDKLETISGVADVSAKVEISDFILSLRKVVGAVSVSLIVMLLGVSVFIISNTVKLATFERREEIAIMRVVGATHSFIRWPFIIEGFLLGVIGAVAGFFLQWGIYSYMDKAVQGVLPIFAMQPFGDLLIIVFLLFIVFGFVVGVLGSALTIRKFLRV